MYPMNIFWIRSWGLLVVVATACKASQPAAPMRSELPTATSTDVSNDPSSQVASPSAAPSVAPTTAPSCKQDANEQEACKRRGWPWVYGVEPDLGCGGELTAAQAAAAANAARELPCQCYDAGAAAEAAAACAEM